MQTFFLRKSTLDGFCSATHDHDGAGNVFEFFHAGKHMSEHRHTGQSRVTVPEAFYKVVFCPEPLKAIGFIYKNKSGNRPLDAYVNSVDEVERITGIDFFPSLPDSVEEAVEAVYDLEEWQMPER